ncbi:PDZ and LIM domain protein 3 isoform X1 [Anolis carolinensis]|uniref:PDZ and LIM domain protein 3 isoform X1 n=1 Tax=Anolis carolinensis TaxID=28377 RepID=UPI0001F9C413|nr:PREDICTED: PDZ and LIM domain protein 3 isoform X1 [Anolis carolinensis]|eukprot:XP_003221665.1 PREDICTED: PDZ and LIM domain protein 3 isoform X1 [Anolis carolinensis]
MPQNVVLPGPAPWGFRLTGGIDFNQPLLISRITPGSKASQANLCPGDIIIAIDGYSTENMTHNDAQERIKAASHQLSLKIERGETKLWSPQISEDGKPHPFKINLEAEPQDMGYFEHKHNIRPKPFIVSGPSSVCSTPSGFDGGSGRSTPSSVSTVSTICPTELKAAAKMAPNIPLEMELPGVKIVHAQFNTPMQLYSDDNIMETLQGQVSTALGEGTPQSDPVPAAVPQSDVYRMLHDDQQGASQPRQSGSFKVLQDMVSEESDGRPVGTRSVRAPVTKMSPGGGSVPKVPLCDKCGNGIVGPVVKARDKYRHPECFVCSDCNLNLKQKGYFFVEGQLYCETHARARMRPPEGYEAVTVYPKA